MTPADQGVLAASKRGGGIRGGSHVGQVATSPLRPGGVPTASKQGPEPKVAHKCAGWLHNPYRLGGPRQLRAGADSEVADKWAEWLDNP